ncbi:DUF6660 family protein [Flavicella sp.]|uniref:DUF6660 family protein n=1 Tax=Flavicella sp. TaxID=2957742 RepID=UPI0030195A09
MNYVTFILSIYILALSFVTCSDTTADSFFSEDETDFDQENHSHSEDIDSCSPFCSCQCCQVTVDVFHFSTFNLSLELILLEEISSIHNDLCQEVYQSLYQPPIV